MATHSRTLAWKIPQTEEPGSYSPWGRKESDTTEQLHSHSFTDYCSFIVRLESRWNKSSNLSFLFKIVLAILGFHCILILQSACQFLQKCLLGFLWGLHLNYLQINWESTSILTLISLSVYKPGLLSIYLGLLYFTQYTTLVSGKKMYISSVQFSSVAESCPTLCDPMNRSTPGLPVHHQLPESTETMSIESVMPSNHLILCHPLLLPSIFPSIRVFSNESALRIRWPKHWIGFCNE